MRSIKKLLVSLLTACLVLTQVFTPIAGMAKSRIASSDATLSDLMVEGKTVIGFSPDKLSYDVVLPDGRPYVLPNGKFNVPVVNGKATDNEANVEVTPAASLPGTTTVVVKSQDATNTYEINFTLATLINAKFNGLTEIAVDTVVKLAGITADDIVITAGGYTVPASKITNITTGEGSLTVELDPSAFASNSSVGATIATKAFGRFSAGPAVAVAPSSDPLADVWSKLTKSATGYDSVWHNLTSQTNMRAHAPNDPTAYTAYTGPDGSTNYKQVGTIKALLIVIDFPDTKAADNTGINGLPGKTPTDKGNRVNGHILKTADDYYNWLLPRAHDWFDTDSYGQLNLDVTLVKNPNAGDGVFTCNGNLYSPNAGNNNKAYSFDRGGDVTTYLKDALGVAKPVLSTYPGTYDMIYVVAVENAPGISYGPTDTRGTTANTYSGRTDFKSLVRIGYDSYSTWRTKAVDHETGHSIGLVDYYINGFSGYGGGQCDPNTGTADYYPMVGHWDIAGYINGPAPDYIGWDKWRLGWIRDDQVDIINTNGTTTHQLTPIETAGGTKMIVIPGPTNGVAYVIEDRQALGMDNTAVTEASTDPDPNNQNTNWNHAYGTFNSPGILMYKIDANTPTLNGSVTIVDLYPNNTTKELGTMLDSSVLGATSGIYSYTDPAAGITVTLNKETNVVDTVTVTKGTPDASIKPALSDAHFIDLNTIEFKTSMDLRGIYKSNIVVKKGSDAVSGVTINQITPTTIRVTFKNGKFTSAADTANTTISTNAFSFYNGSDAVTVVPLANVQAPVLSEAQFNSLTQIQVKSNMDLSGLTAANMVIKKADNTTIPSSKITGVTFDNDTMLLTVNISADQFTSNASTVGTTIATGAYTSYNPAVLDVQMAKYNPTVNLLDPSATVAVTSMSSVMLDSISITTPPTKTVYTVGDALDITGMVVTGTYSDESQQVVPVTASNVTGFDSSAPVESQILTVTYGGKTATYNVTINGLTQQFSSNAYYKIVNKNSNGVMDSGSDNGTDVINWWDYTVSYPNDCAAAEWKFIDAGNGYYKIINKATSKYIKVVGDVIQQGTDTNDDSDCWSVDKVGDYFMITNKYSQKVLATSGASDGDLIVQNTYSGADNQLWQIIKMDN